MFFFNGLKSDFSRRRFRCFFGNDYVETDLFDGSCDYVNVTRFVLRPNFNKMAARCSRKNIKSISTNQTDKIDGLLCFQLCLEIIVFADGVLKNLIGTLFWRGETGERGIC
jgi:hypothetical protein